MPPLSCERLESETQRVVSEKLNMMEMIDGNVLSITNNKDLKEFFSMIKPEFQLREIPGGEKYAEFRERYEAYENMLHRVENDEMDLKQLRLAIQQAKRGPGPEEAALPAIPAAQTFVKDLPVIVENSLEEEPSVRPEHRTQISIGHSRMDKSNAQCLKDLNDFDDYVSQN